MIKFIFSFLIGLQLLAVPALAYDFVQVSGEGEVKAKPDHVSLSVAVYSREKTASAAQKQNAKEMARVDKILRQDFKIDPKDIQTSQFQVAPQYEYGKDQPIYKGMQVTHSLRVKYRKIDEVGNLFDKLSDGQSQEGFGVRVEDVIFGTDQLKSLQVQALEQAVGEAKSRAQALAKTAGRSLQGVRKISDSRISNAPIEPSRTFSKAAGYGMAEDASSTRIASGEITVRAEVQVEYEIK